MTEIYVYLRLQNVLCVAETCVRLLSNWFELLRDCKLQGLVFRRIISKNQVVCILQLAGWLSKVDRKPLEFSLLMESNVSLKSLRKLSLRYYVICF
ncbi:hypothetical protein BHM03_00040868 [Ensete ventricosum]|nr:hypothetical protein BHM03_00040868 [Ensete ventricosum]